MKIKKIEQINNETKKDAKRAAIERALKIKSHVKAGADEDDGGGRTVGVCG